MSRLFRLLNTSFTTDPAYRRRQWLASGETVSLRRCVIRVSFDRYDETYAMSVLVDAPEGRAELPVPSGRYLKVPAEDGLRIVPRAVELDSIGRPQRVMLEFAECPARARTQTG